MRKNIFANIISIMLALLMLSACSGKNTNPDNQKAKGNDAVVTTADSGAANDKDIVVPKFYYASYEDGSNEKIWAEKQDFAKASDYKFSGQSKTEEIDTKKKSTKNVLELGNFIYKESRSVTGPDSQTASVMHGVYDMYVSSDGKTEAEYFEGTDVMTFFFASNVSQTGTKITENEAIDIAKSFLEKALTGYSLKGLECSVQLDDGTFKVVFKQMTEGVCTSEAIMVGVTEYGEIRGYNGRCVKKLEKLGGVATVDSLNNAEKLLVEALDKTDISYTVQAQKYIDVDYSGNVYMVFKVDVALETDISTEIIYVPM